MKDKIALVTGSFDPITVGHTDIIERASKLFDKVVVVVADNEEKSYMFSHCQRVEIAKAAVANIKNVTVELCNGLVADFALSMGAAAFVRGIRDDSDVAYEQNMAKINYANSGVDTLLLFANPTFNGISSTKVREAIRQHESLEALMPPAAAEKAESFLV